MIPRKILILHLGSDEKPWALYWSDTGDLATEQTFATIEEAEPAARRLMSAEDLPIQPVSIETHPAWRKKANVG